VAPPDTVILIVCRRIVVKVLIWEAMKRKPSRPSPLWPSKGAPEDGRVILAANVRRLRRDFGFSQEALAERAGIHRTYLGSVERSERNIAIDNICRLAWALGVDPADLLKHSN
jgi:DNA-binding XRE family transcriptional regulator